MRIITCNGGNGAKRCLFLGAPRSCLESAALCVKQQCLQWGVKITDCSHGRPKNCILFFGQQGPPKMVAETLKTTTPEFILFHTGSIFFVALIHKLSCQQVAANFYFVCVGLILSKNSQKVVGVSTV